ncbi:sulfite dehydrogenase (cytochrome) subunit SorA apoprotein [Paraglaciecola sp. T6c]|uniref:sulfite oxidase n=1 Tax=Pseudoalteromonas atlantica (strain T6c / ATCC BAA-1087) TaxID=3042615 RepID=UPI00005C610F|nr:sulfite oxidase [Paraglaciecola sp. T6c]ABG41382.1 sulfite dehydrogenase (cytochrome) subunit SorA apoprotein [Paraglaciecola sp. T6c]
MKPTQTKPESAFSSVEHSSAISNVSHTNSDSNTVSAGASSFEAHATTPINNAHSGLSRRKFLLGLGVVTGAQTLLAPLLPSGMISSAFAQTNSPSTIIGKSAGLVVLNDRPINAETPAHMLDDKITSAENMFVRNNGIPPSEIDVSNWVLTIEGESAKQRKQYSLEDLKQKFTHHSYQITLECGGNGRAEFNPGAKGNQWTTGAVACPKWTGVRLADVLKDVGIKDDAVYIGYYGKDTHISGDPSKEAISRGVPIDKALEQENLIAWAMNDADIPIMNGHPLRLVIGGWPASTSGKWLERIVIRDQVHDGAKMAAPAYRVPCEPVAPGSKVAAEDMCIIHAMPVKSLITFPKSGESHKQSQTFAVRGHAWAGDKVVSEVHISVDFGQTWQQAKIEKPVNRNAWQHWQSELNFPAKGYFEVWARATDSDGISQPMILPGWNPKGYLNNACHRVAVQVV